jgi:hypothetical protein
MPSIDPRAEAPGPYPHCAIPKRADRAARARRPARSAQSSRAAGTASACSRSVSSRRRADVRGTWRVRSQPALDLGDAPLGVRRSSLTVVDRAKTWTPRRRPARSVSRSENTWIAAESGQIGAVPSAEACRPAGAPRSLSSPWAECRLVRVPEDHVGPERAHLSRMERLHGALRPDRHERGRPDRPVGRLEDARPRGAVRRLTVKLTAR